MKTLFRKLKTLALILLIQPLQSEAQTSDEWWFDIEVIVFKRDVDPASLDEQFEQKFELMDVSKAKDLYSSLLRPDLSLLQASLPVCGAEPSNSPTLEFAGFSPEPAIINWDPSSEAWQQWLESSTELLQQPEPTSTFDNGTPFDDFVIIGSVEQPESIQTPTENTFADPAENSDEHIQLLNMDSAYSENHAIYGDLTLDWQLPPPLDCRFESPLFSLSAFANATDDGPALPYPDMPLKPIGLDFGQQDRPHLLAASDFRLNGIYRGINRLKGVTPILHTAWRQPVEFGRSRAQSFRLIAGENFATTFDIKGNLLPPASLEAETHTDVEREDAQAQPIFAKIEEALDGGNPVPSIQQWIKQLHSVELSEQDSESQMTDQLYALDGLFKVYLQYIGRVPYLHIDSQLDLRVPVQSVSTDQATINQAELKHFRFNQLRRVISKQLHYFDHPLFGMVVEINRYRRIQQTVTDTQTTDAN